MLFENQRINDFTGVYEFNNAGFTGKHLTEAGYAFASAEQFSVSDLRALGYNVFSPVPNISLTGDDHSLKSALSFFVPAPDARLATLPLHMDFTASMAAIKANKIIGAFDSWGAAPNNRDRVDVAIGELPYFFYVTAAGNDGEASANPFMSCKNVYGIGSYFLSVQGTPFPAPDSSTSPDVDWAAPGKLYVRTLDGITEITGTSFANPYHEGKVALVQDFFVYKTDKIIGRNMINQFFLDFSHDMFLPGKDEKTGYGYVRLPNPRDIDIKKYTGENIVVPVTPIAAAYPIPEMINNFELTLNSKTVTVDGVQYEIDTPISYDPATQRLTGPIRLIAQLTGVSATWNDTTKTARFTRVSD